MRNVNEIADYLEQKINQVYERPRMYGGTGEGVDLVLCYLHEIWAMVHCREDDYLKVRLEIHEEEGCNGCSFAHLYRRDKPDASEEETVRYVVLQWKKITSLLGIAVL